MKEPWLSGHLMPIGRLFLHPSKLPSPCRDGRPMFRMDAGFNLGLPERLTVAQLGLVMP